jgi:hypothetical protein
MIRQDRILAAVVGVALGSSMAVAQPRPPGPLSQPTVNIAVDRKSGTCPASIGLWWIVLPYEGGSEHTVVLDSRAFSDSTKQVAATRQTVDFVMPLRSNYASCVGQTRNQFPWYTVQFRNKQAYFRVDLKQTQAAYTQINQSTVAASRPFVRWAIAD